MFKKRIFILFYLIFIIGISYSQLRWFAPDVRVNTSLASPLTYSYTAQFCRCNESVYAVWTDDRKGDWNYDIYFNYSEDGGMTWLSTDIKLNTINDRYMNPKICCSGQNVYVVWELHEYEGGGIFFNYSHDGGVTWQDSQIASGFSTGKTQIVCYKDYVYVTWINGGYSDGINQPGIHFNYSADGGVTWLGKSIKVNNGDNSGWPEICCAENKVYIVWDGWQNGQKDIFFNYSHNHGATWQDTEIRIDHEQGPYKETKNPKICCSNNNVYVVWEDYRNRMIYFNYSSNSGKNWLSSDIRVSSLPLVNDLKQRPQISIEGDRIYVVWQDTRDRFWDLYSNYSINGGDNWQENDIRVNAGAKLGDSSSFHISSFQDNLFVVWNNIIAGKPGLYLNYSLDNGTTWQSENIKIDDNLLSKTSVRRAQILATDSKVDVFWSEGRDQRSDIYFNQGRFDSEANQSLLPPLNFFGEHAANRSLSQIEYVNALSWKANPENEDLKGYRLYLRVDYKWVLMVEMDTSTFNYWHRNVGHEKIYNYALVALNNKGQESHEVTFTLNIQR